MHTGNDGIQYYHSQCTLNDLPAQGFVYFGPVGSFTLPLIIIIGVQVASLCGGGSSPPSTAG